MKTPGCTFLLAAACIVFPGSAAFAHHVRHHHYAVAPRAYPYDWSNWQAEVIARATERAQTEPGVTLELAPDAKETATGGPVGGVPGFSGH